MIDVKNLVVSRKEKIKNKVSQYSGIIKLDIIQVGDNPASNSYIKGKVKDCEEVGIIPHVHKFEENVDPMHVYHLITILNQEFDCKGIIIQLPLPKQFSKEWVDRLINSIHPYKDVDGFRRDSKFIPCTPKGIMTILGELLNEMDDNSLNGKVACVIGRSEIIGKPMVKLLIEAGCTIINCNSHTKDLDKWLRESDIIITAVGKPKFLSFDNAVHWKNQIIIDVGINRNEEGKLCGDCSPELYEYVAKITPVPNGVGLTTRLSLLENIVEFLNN